MLSKRIITILSGILFNRLARNIYFWLVLLITKIYGAETNLPKLDYYFLTIFNFIFFVGPCSINNFLLVPKLLRQKKTLLYFISALGLVFITCAFYTLWLKFLMHHYANLNIFEISIVAPEITNDLSVASIWEDLWGFFYILLLMIVAFTGLWYIQDHRRNEKRAEDALKKQTEIELNFLKNQLNPHFLFNTLNNLYGLSLQHSEQTPEVILKLSSVLRYILYDSNEPLIEFEKEKEVMQAYIDIEMLRLQEKSAIQFSIMSDQFYKVPPLLWLPVLENLFKHGGKQLSLQSQSVFRYSIHQGKLNIYSENPVGDNKTTKQPGGIGLNNLSKRLEILYPDNHHFSTKIDENNHYCVNIQVHIHE